MSSYATEVEIFCGARGPARMSTAERRLAAARDATDPGDDAERDRDVVAAEGCARSGGGR
jgi:hypothetical protein